VDDLNCVRLILNCFGPASALVTNPFGRFGISSLKELCWALRMRWLWLHKIDPGRPWANLTMQVPKKARSFFSTVLVSEVGNGARTLSWTDKWLLGQNVSNLAPRLFAIIPKRIANRRTVLEALANIKWISDIKGALSVGAIVDYLNLWEILSDIVLHPVVEDKHVFSIAADGKYSAKLAYEGLFVGSTSFGHYHLVWKTWAPPKCQFFLWLATNKRCWTADRLAKRGLFHPARCLLCDQEAETLDHILVSCVFTRVFWFNHLKPFGFERLTPQLGLTSFMIWWEQISEMVSGLSGKGLNSLFFLEHAGDLRIIPLIDRRRYNTTQHTELNPHDTTQPPHTTTLNKALGYHPGSSINTRVESKFNPLAPARHHILSSSLARVRALARLGDLPLNTQSLL
jgi:hypothetical protein